MSVYLKKSNENIECARHLYKSKKFYPSIVHSSYYSVFQLGKHILIDEMLRSENSLDDEQIGKNIGVHELYNNLLVKEIKETDEDLALEINNSMSKLKQYRVESDYKIKEFDSFEYGIIITSAELILTNLKSKFKIK